MKKKEYVLLIMSLGIVMMLTGCGNKTEVAIPETTEVIETSTEQETIGYETIKVDMEYPAIAIVDTSLLSSTDAKTKTADINKDTYVTVYGDVTYNGVPVDYYAVRLEDGSTGFIVKDDFDFNIAIEEDYANSLEEIEGGDGEEVAEEPPAEEVTEETQTEEAPVENANPYNIIDCNPVPKYTNTGSNIRSIPDKSGELVDTVAINTELTITGTTEDGSWSRTERNGLVCFIKSSLLSDSKTEVKTTNNNNQSGGSGNQASNSTPSQPAPAPNPEPAPAPTPSGNWGFLNDYPTAGDMQTDEGRTGSLGIGGGMNVQ